jgi:hypothetical protein
MRERLPKRKTAGEIAQDIKNRGWKPVPVEPDEKSPRAKNWQHKRVNPKNKQHFPDDWNVGVQLGECSKCLVDVDNDCPEAMRLAP